MPGRSGLQDDVAYLLKEWGIYEEGKEKIKGVKESRLCKISPWAEFFKAGLR